MDSHSLFMHMSVFGVWRVGRNRGQTEALGIRKRLTAETDNSSHSHLSPGMLNQLHGVVHLIVMSHCVLQFVIHLSFCEVLLRFGIQTNAGIANLRVCWLGASRLRLPRSCQRSLSCMPELASSHLPCCAKSRSDSQRAPAKSPVAERLTKRGWDFESKSRQG